jgi:putative ATP-binding cassette transporter
VLDEWAADQDPETRKRFYEEILPMLRAEGRTIFAITHDEQYFSFCDRRLHMVEGRLVQGDPR